MEDGEDVAFVEVMHGFGLFRGCGCIVFCPLFRRGEVGRYVFFELS